MKKQAETEEQCCPVFEPTKWDNVTVEWNNKNFVKDHVCTLFYIPLNFGSVMRRLDKKVRTADAQVLDWLCLSDHTSKWNMDLYLAVDKPIANAENTSLSGKYYGKVYEGSFKDTDKWMKDFNEVLQTKGYHNKKLFMWYTTCPKCAKKYGKNYVVILSQIE
jgi:hypothetical protein